MTKNLPDKIIESRGNLPSFGGCTLVDNLKKAEHAIAKMEYTERIYDRSRSQFALKNLVTSFPSDWKNLRQISAEMQRKRDALREAKYNYAKKLKEAEIKEAKADRLRNLLSKLHDADEPYGSKRETELKIDMLEIEISEIREGAEAGIPKIEGALKELQTLEAMHDSLIERLGEISEDAYERHEARSNIKRAMIQATREFRVSGKIQTGNQEYLEQCGINVTMARLDIVKFLQKEAESDISTKLLWQWLEEMAEKYEKCALEHTALLGFSPEPLKEICYDRKRDERS